MAAIIKVLSEPSGPLTLFQRAQKGLMAATLEGNKQVHRTWFVLQSFVQADKLESLYFQVMMSQYGLSRSQTIKRYLAHVLWDMRIQPDMQEFVDPVALTSTAYWCHILDKVSVGWTGKVKTLTNGCSIVKEYLSWAHSGCIDNASYPQGQFMAWGSFRYKPAAMEMSARSAEMKGKAPRAEVGKFIQVNNCPKRQTSAASHIRVTIIDPTNSLSPKAIQAELDRRRKAGCYAIVEY